MGTVIQSTMHRERPRYMLSKMVQCWVLDGMNMIFYFFIMCCYTVYIFLKLCDFSVIEEKNILFERIENVSQRIKNFSNLLHRWGKWVKGKLYPFSCT